ncbi:N-glycosylase/DNA lyase [Candidatus Gugararchaeum adminiculabundum]|nr:N-glycosylase/DNA lyase [Candidatus Gugararchaeum adminiculabundum]
MVEVTELKIGEQHLKKFKKIRDLFLSKTEVPTKDNWKTMDNNEIWLTVVRQAMVVGSSASVEKMEDNKRLENWFYKVLSYNRLKRIKNEEKVREIIQKTLYRLGTRYYANKAKFLTYNFRILKTFKGGPKNMIKQVSELDSDKLKIGSIIGTFRYMKHKSARDFLMTLGVLENAVAFDTRVASIFKKVGIKLPRGFAEKKELYEEVEHEVLDKICKQLEISGVQFDRLLYQKMDEIKKTKL